MTAAPTPRPPPESVADLITRARALAGRSVSELAADLGARVPPDQRRAKGFVGQLLERALGATAGSSDRPDFEALGVELKTIPVDGTGRPRESTFVCTIPMSEIAEVDWEQSRVYRKLAHVLFVPIESAPDLPLGARRIGGPVEWRPDEAQERDLRADWDELAGLVGRGDVESVTAHLGRYLQVRPKAAHSRIRGRAPEAEGGWLETVPRGFYLRATFTEAILRAALAPSMIT